MTIPRDSRKEISVDGFTIINNVYTEQETDLILSIIAQVDTSRPTFRKSADVFAIRQFLKEVPAAIPYIFNNRLISIISTLFGESYFVVKGIYFDKPAQSNWFVAYHQDLTISVDKKIDLPGYGPWTVKQDQFAVQPPLTILENNFTIRIHLDATNEENGALKVIPESHLKGVYRPDTIDWSIEEEKNCCVNKGGIMIMNPLLLHSSGRTTNGRKRRVIHIELSNQMLNDHLQWAEFMEVSASQNELTSSHESIPG